MVRIQVMMAFSAILSNSIHFHSVHSTQCVFKSSRFNSMCNLKSISHIQLIPLNVPLTLQLITANIKCLCYCRHLVYRGLLLLFADSECEFEMIAFYDVSRGYELPRVEIFN